VALLVWVSCADRDEAARIGRALVEARLAACVHLRPHDSIYRWQGAVEMAAEYTLLIKTLPGLRGAVEAAVKRLHSYALPAILAVPVEAEAATLEWILGETAG
jgi:periplasmic divalent cation tolerance protein